jgi:hypothetical protein
MLKIVTKNQNLIRLAYSSEWLSKFIVFDISGIDSVNDPVLRNTIVSNIVTEERHGKATAPGRFKDLDEIASKHVKPGTPNIVHDIGVSSGITSCDFYDSVFSKLKAEYFISDKYTRYYYTGRRVIRIFDVDRRLLYGSVFSLLANKGLGRYYPIASWLYWILDHIPPIDVELKEICLLDHRTIAYINEGKLKCIDYDVFRTTIANRFTYVRCMNVLNRNSWFSDEQISKALAAICDSIVEGGILQVGRSRDNGMHDASFFRKDKGRMQLLESVNRGTELMCFVVASGVSR